MVIHRRKSKVIKIGSIYIGGDNPVAIQSMVKTRTSDVQSSSKQIKELVSVGCEIVRLAVRDTQDAKAIRQIKKRVKLPIVADIHFDWRLAVEAVENGADKIRLNPGNIYKKEEIEKVVACLKMAKVPLRIGVNSGSVREVYSRKTDMPVRLVTSALNYVRSIERLKFFDMVISLKASTVLDTVAAYRKMAKVCDYPLHLGVTATGLPYCGAIKSSIAMGVLLLEGIGDTIRVSLTDKPQEEVRVAKVVLESLGLRNFGPEIISCPTCGRCEVDLVKIVKELENKIKAMPACPAGRNHALASVRPYRVAIMGCVVNGPGEAKEADMGIAFGKKEGLLFKGGKAIKKIPYHGCLDYLLKEMEMAHA